jgi:hypothetical protein
MAPLPPPFPFNHQSWPRKTRRTIRRTRFGLARQQMATKLEHAKPRIVLRTAISMSKKSVRIKTRYLNYMSRKSGSAPHTFLSVILTINRWWKGKIKEEEKQDLTSKAIRDLVLCRDSPAPSLVHVKDFFRFYTKQSKGRINKHSSVESTVSQAEFFFAGFTRVTGTPTLDKERSEVYWVIPDANS